MKVVLDAPNLRIFNELLDGRWWYNSCIVVFSHQNILFVSYGLNICMADMCWWHVVLSQACTSDPGNIVVGTGCGKLGVEE